MSAFDLSFGLVLALPLTCFAIGCLLTTYFPFSPFLALLLQESPWLRILCRVPDYFVTAIDLRKSATLYEKNASPITATIAKLRHTAANPPPR